MRSSANAHDGYPLAITRFPAQGEAWANLVIAGAMGVRQEFYAGYARHCAGQGMNVLTFDYRGMGGSRSGDLAQLDADVMTWVNQDLDAMLHEARRMGPQLPLAFFGHSLGGQVMGALPSVDLVQAAVTVTAGSGYYKLNQRMRLRVRFLWFVAMPLLTRLFGYFPGRRLRMVGDLPRGVAVQWRRWCLDPRYILAEGEAMRSAFDRVQVPMLAWSFADDAMITGAAVDRMHAAYRRAQVERRHLSPRTLGLARVGHFGFFGAAGRAGLWNDTVAWLRVHTQRPEVPREAATVVA